MSFLKTAISNSLLNHKSPRLWGWLLYGWYHGSLAGVTFPWFFMFRELLCCCLCIYCSNYLFQSLLSDFRREIPSTPLLLILMLFWDLLWINLHICFLLVRILNFICLLMILQLTRLCGDSLLFFLPRAILNTQVCALSLICRPALIQAGFLQVLTSHLPNLALAAIMSTHRELATGWESMWLRHKLCWTSLWDVWRIQRWGGEVHVQASWWNP